MGRALLLVMDSFGIGQAPDAGAYGDLGADTYGHIAQAAAHGAADRPGLRQGPLRLPNLCALGLDAAAGRGAPASLRGRYGSASEVSRGKDTPSGHWEIAGVPVSFDWGYFPRSVPALPAGLTAALVQEAGLPGILGNSCLSLIHI